MCFSFIVGVTCTDYDVRFQDGSNNYGRLEVCLFQEWGSICDDGWDRRDARTICRQRNFNPSCKHCDTKLRLDMHISIL